MVTELVLLDKRCQLAITALRETGQNIFTRTQGSLNGLYRGCCNTNITRTDDPYSCNRYSCYTGAQRAGD